MDRLARSLCALLASTGLPGAALAQECFAKVWDVPVGGQVAIEAGGDLYVAGFSQPAGSRRIARLDASGWTVLPGLFDGRIRSIAASGAELVVGGEFTTIDGVPASRVARFDGVGWLPLGGGVDGLDARVNAVHEYGGAIYVGGEFDGAGGVVSPNLVRYQAGAWTDVWGGLDGPVADLETYEGDLVVAGAFTDAAGLGLASVVAFDGIAFAPLGLTPLPAVDDLDESAGRLAALADGKLRLFVQDDWVLPGAQPVDVYGTSVAFRGGGLYVNGIWNTFCKLAGGGSCLARAAFQGGTWSFLGFDESFPNVDWVSLASVGGALYETGGSDGLMKRSSDLSLFSYGPGTTAWYEPIGLSVSIGCFDPNQPVHLALGDLPPELATPGAPGLFQLDLPSAATGQTGRLSLEVSQGSTTLLVPEAVLVLPLLNASYVDLFGPVVVFNVQVTADDGVALFYVALAEAVRPLAIPGVFSPALLEPAAAFFVGAGTAPLFGGFQGSLSLNVPPGTGSGLTLLSQAAVIETPTAGGVFVSLTQLDEIPLP